MTYIIIEIQKDAEGNVTYLVNKNDTRNGAESTYHQILAAAAISSVYQHTAVLLTDTGMEIMHQCYVHEPAPEPEEE